jgi:hypothetical protein
MNSSIPQPSDTGDRLKTREYIGYALGDTASNFFFQTFNIFLTYYYVDVWGIPATALLWMFPIIRLFDACNDPAMGLIADRTNTRWGKFRPYLLWGAIPYGICGYLMFAGPDFGPTGKLVYAYITYALMLISYTVINVPYSSLMGVLSPSSRTRTVASSFRFVGAFAGAFLISLFVRPLVKYLGGDNEMRGFQWTMAIFAIVSVILFWITFVTTKERVKPPAGQKSNVIGELRELIYNWPWVMLLIASVFSTTFIALRSGSTVFYFKYVVGDDGMPIFLGLDRTTIFLSTGALAQVAVKKQYFPDQFTVIPNDGDKVTVGDTELTWHAVDTYKYNVNLYYFAYNLDKPTSNVLFWAVTIINCPQEMSGVRLAIGSNAASVWWVNGKEVIGIYGDRQTVIDDGVSKRLTLKKGPNVVRCAVVNGGGATDFCARFLDSEDKPLKGFTVSVGESGK